MNSKIAVYVVFCFTVCIAFYDCAPFDERVNEVQTDIQVFSYSILKTKYENYIKSPTPREEMVSTKDLAEKEIGKHIYRAHPPGVVLRKCPEFLPSFIDKAYSCHSSASVKVTLEIFIYNISLPVPSKKGITATEDTECVCNEDK